MPLAIPDLDPCPYCENFAERYAWHGPLAVIAEDDITCGSDSDMELIELQASTSFRHDARGRLLGINKIDSGQSTPRLFLGRTTAGNI